LDACGPASEIGVVLDICFVQLVARQRLARAVPKVCQGLTTLTRKEDQPMANLGGNQNWLALYREAVLEPDREKVKTRVAQAQMAIQGRARELWYAGAPETSERRQMDAASNFLGILRTIGEDKW
jgi:hypothetical protein